MRITYLFFSLLLCPVVAEAQIQINVISGKIIGGSGFIATSGPPPITNGLTNDQGVLITDDQGVQITI